MLLFIPLVLSRKPFHDFTPVAMAMTLSIFVFQSSALFNMRLRAQQARWRSRVRDQRAEENTWRHPKFSLSVLKKILYYSTTWLVMFYASRTMNTVMSYPHCFTVSMLNYVYKLTGMILVHFCFSLQGICCCIQVVHGCTYYWTSKLANQIWGFGFHWLVSLNQTRSLKPVILIG